ncbi:hypothetical protein BJ085DRAFT_43334 [Dimargaris cristalligena]|uniref:DNA topoisomerase I n=1 Tax=Dimargaris cristalligena TaxID=215637 RepID=A0A4P9ZKD5_9FUNG|nr:hypothetical protein BJ085DRAFT_43334 [Dimargaris cristalligena]|eukprot:RKP33508.1 hypothetical protein BJ085DRAFT_43334 [Dimargaris cristalligena]
MSSSDSDDPGLTTITVKQLQTVPRPRFTQASDSDSDDEDQPLAQKILQKRKAAPILAPAKQPPSALASDSDSEDDKPLAQRSRPQPSKAVPKPLPARRASTTAAVAAIVAATSDSDSDDDVPLAQKVKAPPTKRPAQATAPKRKPAAHNDSSDSDSDVPLAKKVKSNSNTPAKKENGRVVSTPGKSTTTTSKAKITASTSKATATKTNGKVKVKAESKKSPGSDEMDEEEEGEEYKWWLEQNANDTIKWTTLAHNGVYFPPEYVPHKIPLVYDNKEIALHPEAEEIASYYAQMLETDHAKNPTFVRNFFKDFRAILNRVQPGHPITDFDKCNFTRMYDHFEKLREIKRNMSKEDKQKLKDEKDAIKSIYGFATLDGRKENLGNYNIEPPGLFRGRGDHPRTGCYKRRVRPEDITINIGPKAKVPPPPPGHRWKNVIHDNKVGWLAMWRENVNDQFKYVQFGATSSLKGQSDLKKFEKARNLKGCVDTIRRDYMAELRDKSMAIRQRATALYLIDKLALRAGNEKGEDEADTVGCCSLRYEHVTLQPPNILVFDFLGKDSVRYYNAVPVDDQVFKNIRIFKKPPKTEGEELFDRLTTTGLNNHLKSLMPGLSAKVFRTYNASHTLQEELKNTPANGTIQEKILAYNRANRRVAELCNHQRAVGKAFGTQMEKLQDRIRALKYQRQRMALQLAALDPKYKRKHPAFYTTEGGEEGEANLSPEWNLAHERDLTAKERVRIEAKFEKDNAERKARKEKPLGKADLQAKLNEAVTRKEKLLAKDKLPSVKEFPPLSERSGNLTERLASGIDKITDRIKNTLLQIEDKDENKTIALGTSKLNYNDPRITIAWSKKHGVPIEKSFTRTLRDKFKWAMDVVAK